MKKLYLLLSLFVLVSFLPGCYTYPPSSTQPNPFTIEVKVDKKTYHIGEKIVIIVRASRDCYLTLYDISTQGEVTQIFPNRYASDNLINGGQVYRIPNERDVFDFEIIGPPGIERVRAIGTIDNVNFVDQRKIDKTETFPRIYENASQFDKSVSEKLQAMPAERWAEASITFQVVP
jgi:hypothetical protein